jgi:hypothetical protein
MPVDYQHAALEETQLIVVGCGFQFRRQLVEFQRAEILNQQTAASHLRVHGIPEDV